MSRFNQARSVLGDICTGPDWVSNVAAEIPPNPAVPDAMAPILEDIEDCNLPGVSRVIPDGSRKEQTLARWFGLILAIRGKKPTPNVQGGAQERPPYTARNLFVQMLSNPPGFA